MRFVPRRPELLALEGQFEGFYFSCRHRDILRCSDTRHFSSCYGPKGCYKDMPSKICADPNFAMIFERDKSGQFLWRAFVLHMQVQLISGGTSDVFAIGRFYGNGYEHKKHYIKSRIPDSVLTDRDFTVM